MDGAQNSILLLITSGLNIFIGFYAFISQPKKFLNWIFWLFSINVSGWILSIFLLSTYSQKIIFGEMPFVFAALAFYFLLIFIVNLGKRTPRSKWHVLFLFIPTLILILLSLSGKIVNSASIENNSIVVGFANLYHFYTVYIVAYLIGVIAALFYKLRSNKGAERQKIRYVLLGIGAFIIPASLTNLILPTFFGIWKFNIIGPVFSLLMLLAICYSIIRFHLMDIWVIVRRSAIFSLLFLTITFIYVADNYLLMSHIRLGEPWDSLIPSLIVALTFVPLKHLIEAGTDKFFFRKRYKFTDLVGKIEESIHAAGLNLDKTLEDVNRIIVDALKVKWGAIFIVIPKDHFISRQVIGGNFANLKLLHSNPIIEYLAAYPHHILDKEDLERKAEEGRPDAPSLRAIIKELDKYDFSLAVPIRFKDRLVGVYLLGAKLSQDPFTKEDLSLLRHVAWEMSFAIDNARSYEELKHLSDAKSNFISVVSHQLRTPVAASRVNLELCFDKETSAAEKTESMKAAYNGTIALSRQLDQLLLVLEIEEQRIVIKKIPTDISHLLKETVKDNEANMANKKLLLEMDIDRALPEVRCDSDKIRKILDIILVNAINYSPTGGRIIVSAKKSAFNQKEKLVIGIADDGMGIKDEDKNEVFKKFFRSPEAILVSPNGFGLGLFISKKIIDAHGGEIWFENHDGGGTIFYFSLPLKK
jgi:signal transduction histidine kinase